MRSLTAFLLCLVFSSCGLDNSYFLFRNFEKDQVLTTSIGNPMTQTKVEYRNNVYGNVRASTSSELIYSGKAGNVVKLIYREYSNDMARPAFTQDVQYDLNETKTIKFKNTTIEVIQATNQDITFKVLGSPSLRYKTGKMSDQDVKDMEAQK